MSILIEVEQHFGGETDTWTSEDPQKLEKLPLP